MDFFVIGRDAKVPDDARSAAYLQFDRWNDYKFVTMFYVVLYDEVGERHNLENVKIGFKGQETSTSTYSKLPPHFTELPEGFFSLGNGVEYYSKLAKIDSLPLRFEYLNGLKDIVANPEIIDEIIEENVFSISLLRDVSLSSVKGQFPRVLQGGAVRTDYSFVYAKLTDSTTAGIEIGFEVEAESTPPTNIHALIGRNGIGKTTILNGMINSIRDGHARADGIYQINSWGMQKTPISQEFFSSVVLVSFSAFDPFDPPPEQPDPAKGTCFYYVGLKAKGADGHELKNREALKAEFLAGMRACLKDTYKRNRWKTAIQNLQSDENFAEMGFLTLLSLTGGEFVATAEYLFSNLSSGHAIVLLTITRLVERVEEKTLVLLDEPESHLHPPLLSAFIRALSELLLDRNGVAIIATHSPVVLQEIPSSCVWKVNRSQLVAAAHRPSIETFGENVGTLTREIFGLEVTSSGFHTLLAAAVMQGKDFEQIIREFNGQLGFEAQAILRVLLANRDSKAQV
ncbi:AAA domain-containing protein, putative AbiEii toxin, Type IV TA system [Azotobacter beijerinckii]|uniref:AAA domain-containing protein, putative AbiEii toxin, Type IV TA system n=1 Tax=Azotobacter beijerinckii TaxID=170623 RepID=A0A1H6YHE0_9GAMM|nr:AAA family ATPase [Azotobacter beijerinckii]SEJ36662.1 AAA domain-containing protein, putative AbiEii toxin, Type IV TA system [Azotobacter beijerinckii]